MIFEKIVTFTILRKKTVSILFMLKCFVITIPFLQLLHPPPRRLDPHGDPQRGGHAPQAPAVPPPRKPGAQPDRGYRRAQQPRGRIQTSIYLGNFPPMTPSNGSSLAASFGYV